MADPRIEELRQQLEAAGDAAQATAQKTYHKSELRFYGIKAERLRKILREAFPETAFTRPEHLPLVSELWQTDCFDERMAALWLLERMRRLLTPHDLDGLTAMTHDCQGWAELDTLALRIIGPMTLSFGTAVYDPVRRWCNDEWLWTRRASILVHIIPAREKQLSAEYVWPTLDERLEETEFFIRKAVGWTLREIGKHYPREVFGFLMRVGERASGLTRREAARNLPEELRIPILGR